MYAYIPEPEAEFRGSVQARGSATYFSRPTPTLAFANGPMPALTVYLRILAEVNLYSLLQHLMPGNKAARWKIGHYRRAEGAELCIMLDMDVGESSF
jgi:hypothetical protein